MIDFHTGRKRSRETGKRISQAKTGQKYSKKACENISKGHLGIRPTKEQLKRFREKMRSDEVKNKISLGHRIRKYRIFNKIEDEKRKIKKQKKAIYARIKEKGGVSVY